MNNKHGILNHVPHDATIEDLLEFAIEREHTHIYLMPSSNLKYTLLDAHPLLNTAKWDVGENGKFIVVQKNGANKGFISSVTGRSVSPRSQNTRLIFLDVGNWRLKTDKEEDVLSVCNVIEQELNVSMAGSPTSVGLRYLEAKNKRYHDEYFAKVKEVDWLAMKGMHVPSLSWFPAIAARLGWYVYCVDRNGSHPFAAAKEKMGIGKPRLQIGGEFDKKKSGLWCVDIGGGGDVSTLLPPLLPSERAWIPTPLLRVAAMESIGYTINVDRAFLWDDSAPVFERWATDLWNIRQKYKEGTVERQAIKSVMNATVGVLQAGQDMDSYLRPDWYSTITASERAVVWYKAWQIARDTGMYPIGAYCDALYYLSPFPDIRDAIPGVLKNEASLGGYKHVWTLKIDKCVQGVLANRDTHGIALKIGELKKLVKDAQ